jgi:hypothetical protein
MFSPKTLRSGSDTDKDSDIKTVFFSFQQAEEEGRHPVEVYARRPTVKKQRPEAKKQSPKARILR